MLTRYLNVIYSCRIPIILVWIGLFAAGCVFGPKLFAQTTNAIDASKRTQGFESHKIMERFFPFHTQQGLAYAFFHANDNSSILDVPCLEEFSLQFQTSIERYEADNKVQLLHTPLMGYYLSDNMLMQASTISMNGHSTIILIEFEHVEKKLSQDYEVLHKMFDSEYKSACSPAERAQLSAGLLGMSEFNRDAKNNIYSDVLKLCIIALPLALVILLWSLHSVRLFLLAICNVFVAVGASLFITSFFAAYVLKVVTFAPAVLLATALALSVDYSLFILRRFRDEEHIPTHSRVLAKPIQNEMKESQQSAPIEVSLSYPLSKAHILNSIHTSMSTAGRIVMVSGRALFSCFTSLFALRNDIMLPLAICAMITTLVNILTALSLIPAFLFLFPSFFADFTNFGFGRCCCISRRKKDTLLTQPQSIAGFRSQMTTALTLPGTKAATSASSVQSVPSSVQTAEKLEAESKHKKVLYRPLYGFSRIVTNPAVSIVVVVVLTVLSVPCVVYYFGFMRLTLDNSQILTHNSLSTQNFHLLKQDFPAGLIFPLEIVFDYADVPRPEGAPDDLCNSVVSAPFYEYAHTFIANMTATFPDEIAEDGITSIFHFGIGDVNVPFDLMDMALHHPDMCHGKMDDICKAMRQLHTRFVSRQIPHPLGPHSTQRVCDEEATVMNVALKFDPMSSKMVTFLPKFYSHLNTWLKSNPAPQMELPAVDSKSSLSPERRAALTQMGADFAAQLNRKGTNISKFNSLPLSRPVEPLNASLDTGKTKHSYPLSTRNLFRLGIDGTTVQMTDTVINVKLDLPLAFAMCGSICFMLLAFVFKSLIIPIHTLATTFISHFAVFGITAFIFQHAATLFGWVRPMFKEVDSTSFFVLIFGYTLVFGLSLDFDLFLSLSVQEYKKKGREAWLGTKGRSFACCARKKDDVNENELLLKDSIPPPPEVSTRAAVTHAIVSQTGTITSAGLVMTVAFAGLLVSNDAAIVEMGLVLVISVLIDTFIIRLFLVPALFSLFGSLNWFPSRLWRDEMRNKKSSVDPQELFVENGVVCLEVELERQLEAECKRRGVEKEDFTFEPAEDDFARKVRMLREYESRQASMYTSCQKK